MRAPGFGVDIVDLRNPRTRDRHLDARFTQRIFDAAERSLVMGAPDPDRAVWRHWAAKEAAFKAVGGMVHPEPSPPFDHSAVEVVEVRAGGATVDWDGRRVEVLFREDPAGSWVAAVGCLGDIDPAVHWSAADTEDTAVRLGAHDQESLLQRLGPSERRAARGFTHALVRLAARTELAARSGLDAERLEIVTPEGPTGRVPPLVYLDGEPMGGARVSLSHDGSQIAWATWVLDPPI